MPKADIHIGLKKAGSSTIQVWLAENKAALGQKRLHYHAFPFGERKLRNQPHYALRELAVRKSAKGLISARKSLGLNDPARMTAFATSFEETFDAYVKSLEKDATLVISSEYLAAGLSDATLVKSFCNWIGHRVSSSRFIIYLRRQEDWICSRYSQSLRRGSVIPLADFARSRPRTNFNQIVSHWSAKVGRDRLSVRLLDHSFLEGGDLISDYAAWLGVDADAFTRPTSQNEGFSNQEAFDLLTRNAGGVPPQPWFGADQAEDRLRIDPKLTALIRETNEADNERLRAEYFPDRKTLFS